MTTETGKTSAAPAGPLQTMEMVSRSAVWTFDPSLAHVGYTKNKELRLFVENVENKKAPLKMPIESIRALVSYPRSAKAMDTDELRAIMREDRQGVEVVVYRPTRKMWCMGTIVPEACKVSFNGKSCAVATRWAGARGAESGSSEPEDCPLHMCHARGQAIGEDDPHYVRWMRERDVVVAAAENKAPADDEAGGEEGADGRGRRVKAGKKRARTWRAGRPLFPPVDDGEAEEEQALAAREKAGQEEYHAARFLPAGIKRRLVDLLDEIGAHERNRAADVYEEIMEENKELRARLRCLTAPSEAPPPSA